MTLVTIQLTMKWKGRIFMEGIIIVALIAFFAFKSPESSKSIPKSTKKEINQQKHERVPNSTESAEGKEDIKKAD